MTIFPLLSVNVFAQERVNNKVGIHLATPHPDDLEKAAELVNSNGGDWGYVTLVMQENDRDHDKWQEVFDKLRELHLIPIVRLATKAEGSYWRRPVKEDAQEWANFLSSLNWVVKDRYVILFNEPNHGQEWGGNVDARSYAEVAKAFSEKLEEKSKDFIIMLAGLDASAPEAEPNYEDEANFLQTVVESLGKNKFNELFSALSSHSYPNPGMAGSPYAFGRGTVRTYEWERNLLKNLGVKDLPVFITETGWDANNVNRTAIANDFWIAYENVWLPDNRVVAVTPFVLNYQSEPFLNFSWLKRGATDVYPQYSQVQNLNKLAGDPEIMESGQVVYSLPETLVTDSTFDFKILLKNTGQAVWDNDNGYHLIADGINSANYIFSDIKAIKPFQQQEVDLFVKTQKPTAAKQVKIALYRNDKKILEGNVWNLQVVGLPSLKLKATLYPKLKTNGDDFEVQLWNSREQLVFKRQGIRINKGVGQIDEVQNIAIGEKYRVVILKPFYLPRQSFVTFKEKNNNVTFERMWPIDMNQDGKFDIGDIGGFFTHLDQLNLFFP